eukprot:827846-Amphidinium_carterae.1
MAKFNYMGNLRVCRTRHFITLLPLGDTGAHSATTPLQSSPHVARQAYAKTFATFGVAAAALAFARLPLFRHHLRHLSF